MSEPTPAQFGPGLVAQLADIARRYQVDVPTVLRLASEVEAEIRADERAKVAEEIATALERVQLEADALPVEYGPAMRHAAAIARLHARQHTTGEDTDPR